MQNLVVLLESSEDASKSHMNAASMILNRFCIDEDAAFELSGVNYLKELSADMGYADMIDEDRDRLEFIQNQQGKEYSS